MMPHDDNNSHCLLQVFSCLLNVTTLIIMYMAILRWLHFVKKYCYPFINATLVTRHIYVTPLYNICILSSQTKVSLVDQIKILIKLSRGEDWDPINQFDPVTFLCLSHARTWIFNVRCRGLFLCSLSSVKMRGDG